MSHCIFSRTQTSVQHHSNPEKQDKEDQALSAPVHLPYCAQMRASLLAMLARSRDLASTRWCLTLPRRYVCKGAARGGAVNLFIKLEVRAAGSAPNLINPCPSVSFPSFVTRKVNYIVALHAVQLRNASCYQLWDAVAVVRLKHRHDHRHGGEYQILISSADRGILLACKECNAPMHASQGLCSVQGPCFAKANFYCFV